MGHFSNSPKSAPKPIPQYFNPDVLRRRMEEVRRNYGRASGRLFDMCYSIQKTGELPDPGEISNALATFLEARAMAKFLEEMHAYAEVLPATPSRNP